MTNKTERIFGKEATLLRDGDHPVYVLPDGRFAAQWGGNWVAKPNLKALDKLLSVKKPTLKLINVNNGYISYDRDVKVCEVSDLQDGKYLDEEGKRHYAYGDFYLHDEAKAEQLKDLQRRAREADQAFRDEFDAIRADMIPVQRWDFKDTLKEELSKVKAEA